MRIEPLSYDGESPVGEPVGKAASIARSQFHRAHDESPRRAVSRRGKQLHARDYGGASCGKGGLGRQQNTVVTELRPRAAYTAHSV